MNSAYPPTWDKLYEKTINSLRIGLFRSDPTGTILDADSALIHLLHFPDLNSLLKANTSGIWANSKELEQYVRLLNSDQAIKQWQVLLRRFDNTLIWVELSAYAVQNEQGQILYFEGSIQDISERMTAEQERRKILTRLETNERIFRALIENSADGLTVTNREGIIHYISPSTHNMIGATSEKAQGKPFSEFVHPDDLTQVNKFFESILNTPEQPVPFLFRCQLQDSSYHWIEGKANNLLSDPAVQGIVLNFRDVSEQKKAVNKLREDEDELRYRVAFERLILSISTRLINIRTDQMIQELENALEEIGDFTRVDRCHIFLFSADLKIMNCLVEWNREGISGPFHERLQNLPTDSSSSWFAKMQAQDVFYFKSLAEIPQNDHALRATSRWLEEKSMMDVPIVNNDHLVGFMRLASVREERQWTNDEIGLQKLFAEIIANSLERREAETRNQRQIDNLAALLKVEKAITSKTEIGSVMNVVLEQVTSQLGIDAAVILLYDTKTSSLYFGSGRGFKPGRATTALRYLQNPLLERVVAERQMLHMPIPHEWQDIWGNEGFSVYFGVPLVAKGEVNGVLELYHRSEFEPSEDWQTFLFMIAEVSAIAIDNVTLFQNLQRSNRELQQAYDTTLEGWARALELRHQETKDHSVRIVNWVTRLAKMFGIDSEALIHLKRGALLHDIGKMGIPDSILNKTGPLITDEWTVMRKHPQLAYDMLYPIQYLRPALDIPYCHHEWWDGSGYPRGLKGEEIPLAARIFTVVDIWDAITQDRKYRPEPERRWDKKRAMEYLIDQAGKKLDPRVVKAFLHLLETS
jgi:PAS domain S-box-containing protein